MVHTYIYIYRITMVHTYIYRITMVQIYIYIGIIG